jgi:hypothetical protein
MKNEKTLRDEIAMSMPSEMIPTINDEETTRLISEKYGLEWSDDPVMQIEWAMKYQAIIRYKFADAMLEVRNAELSKEEVKKN